MKSLGEDLQKKKVQMNISKYDCDSISTIDDGCGSDSEDSGDGDSDGGRSDIDDSSDENKDGERRENQPDLAAEREDGNNSKKEPGRVK